MAGYIRQSTFADGDVITAAHSNDEFDQLAAAFNDTSGHKHTGAAGDGAAITVVGPAQDVAVSATQVLPKTDNTLDMGSATFQFKDGYFAGNLEVAGVSVGGGASIGTVLDEDDMASDDDTALATQQSIKAYVDAQVTAQDLDFQADTGGALNVDLDSQSLTLTGGTGIDTVGAGQAVTFAIDSTVATLSDSQTLINKIIDAANNTISNINTTHLESGVLDTDLTSVSASDDTLASAKAIKTYVDAQVTAQDLDVAADTGTAAIDLDSQSFTVTGGTGIDTSAAGQTVTLTIDSTVATLTDTQTLTNKTLTSPILDTGVSGTAILDEDSMASDSDTQLATQQSIKAYVDAQVGGIPLGDITEVTAGTGLSGGGTSGAVTLDIDSTVATLTGTQTLTNKTLTSAVLDTGVSGTAILDEDTMASDSATQLATQQSIKAYVDAQVTAGSGLANVVEDTTPQLGGALDTNGNSITFADDDAAVFGADTDLTIVHDSGTNSNIFKADSYAFRSKANANLTMEMLPGATNSVKLYHQGSEKLAVRAGGILVTGAVAATSVTGDGSGLTNLPASGDGGIAMAIALG